MNAKKEFMEITEGHKVVCAEIELVTNRSYSPYLGAISINNPIEIRNIKSLLKVRYSKKGLKAFIDSLDYEYDNWHSPDILIGTIWLTGFKWIGRKTTNGAAYWHKNEQPKIPKYLTK